MAPLTKDSIEVSTSVGETAVAGQPKQASGQLRSDALSLEIPVKVHGSRVTQVVREVTPHTEPFEEQTSTMIVFPQGAVLRMTTAVTVGQMLVVTNAKTRQDAICRVVKVRTFSNAQGYVEIEFSHPQPNYWSVNFSSDAAASAKKPTSAPPPIQREEPKVEPVAEISWAPARAAAPKPQPVPSIPPPAPPARPNAPESSFISIGSQEETQVAASSTSRALPTLTSSPRLEPEREARAAEPPKKSAPINFPSAPPSTPVPSLSMAELLGDELASPEKPPAIVDEREATLDEEKVAALIESSAKISQSSFGSLSGGASLPVGQSKPAEPFTSSLDDIVAELAPPPPAPRQSSGFLIAAAILVVFACVVGGGFYFRQELGLQKPDRAVSLPPSAAAVQSSSNTANRSNPSNPSINDQPAGTTGNQPASGSVPKQTVTVPGTTITVSANAAPDNSSSVTAAGQPPESAKPKGPSVTSDMLASTLNAHPTSASRSSANPADGAPSIDDAGAAGANSDAALPDLPSSGNVAAPPPPVVVPEQPLKVGGDVKEPRLITFKQPNYPLVAKEAHVQGDILISTQIDKAGNVIHMQVISGPTMLRQPALEALRRWKYAPSTLNGQPVSVEMQVTVKFRM